MVVASLGLDSPVAAIPKIGPADSKRLARLSIATVRDLLLDLPFGWNEYGEPVAVADLEDGAQATVIGTVSAIAAKRTLRRRMQLTEGTLLDDRGDALRLGWFNEPFVAGSIATRLALELAEMVKGGGSGGLFEMRNPLYEKVE